MKNLILFFSLMCLAGMAKAAEASDPIVQEIVKLQDHDLKLLSLIDHLTDYVEKVRAEKQEICPSGWEKSEYFLQHSPTEDEIRCEALLMTNCHHIVQLVEICKDNGLIRVKR